MIQFYKKNGFKVMPSPACLNASSGGNSMSSVGSDNMFYDDGENIFNIVKMKKNI